MVKQESPSFPADEREIAGEISELNRRFALDKLDDWRTSAGLAEAAAVLLGHRPGRCPTCEPPPASRRTKAMLAALTTPANLRGAVRPAASLLAFLATGAAANADRASAQVRDVF